MARASSPEPVAGVGEFDRGRLPSRWPPRGNLFDSFHDPIRVRALAPKRAGHKGLIKEERDQPFRTGSTDTSDPSLKETFGVVRVLPATSTAPQRSRRRTQDFLIEQ